MSIFDDALKRFKMVRYDIDAIEHTTFEPIRRHGRQLIDDAYEEYEAASIELREAKESMAIWNDGLYREIQITMDRGHAIVTIRGTMDVRRDCSVETRAIHIPLEVLKEMVDAL